MSSKLQHVLNDNYKLNSLENDIMRYIVKNLDLVANYTIGDVAKANNVSISMISKTLNKVGINGFKHLKLLIGQDLADENVENRLSFSVDVLNHDRNVYQSAIDNTTSNIDMRVVNDIVKAIKNSQQILVYGLNFINLVASEFYQKIKILGLNAHLLHGIDDLENVNSELTTMVIIYSNVNNDAEIQSLISRIREMFPAVQIAVISSEERDEYLIKNTEYYLNGSYRSFLAVYEREFPSISRLVIQFISDIIMKMLFWEDFTHNSDLLARR